MSTTPYNSFQGYVIYGIDGSVSNPYAVVSNNSERKAACTHIPESMQNFLIEIEDQRFFRHKGIDFRAIVRAVVINVKTGKVMQGGGTITQQLARNLLRNSKRTISRKIQEAILAIQLEGKYTKLEILKKYFHEVYFGKQLFGVRSASLYYFGREVEDLNLSDQLSLLTLLRGPNVYAHSQPLFAKRFSVLNNLLVDRHKIDHYLQSASEPLQAYPIAVVKPSVLSYITGQIDAHKKIIHSTIQLNLQSKVREFIEESRYPNVCNWSIQRGCICCRQQLWYRACLHALRECWIYP